MRILGLIPMRAGSKGIPGKNKKLLGGKPLMQYTIEAALASQRLTDVVVSTEDPELAALATKLGAEVPFIRPARLAEDITPSIDVVAHALDTLDDLYRNYNAVCLLQVTTPFRTTAHIDAAIIQFKNGTHEALVSVQEVPHVYNPHWVFEKDKSGTLRIVTGEATIIGRRQDLPKAYIRDGAIYITKTPTILYRKTLLGSNLGCIELSNYINVNLDTEADWELAEKLLRN